MASICRAGRTSGYLKRNRRGMATVEQQTKYKQELRAGALFHITSELLEIKPRGSASCIAWTDRMDDLGSGNEAAAAELVGVLHRRRCALGGAVCGRLAQMTVMLRLHRHDS
jgi:hypothetical protein